MNVNTVTQKNGKKQVRFPALWCFETSGFKFFTVPLCHSREIGTSCV